MEVKLETTGREVIKPSSLAPLNRLELSIMDLYNPKVYVQQTYFYKSETEESPEIISQKLKTSLSETLSRFSPLAGRIESNFINCTNEGVVFSEARTDLLLTDFFQNLNTDSLKEFFLDQNEEGESPGTWPLMKVKVSFFGSGSGFAVCVGISHRICDAASFLSFVQGWAATANGMAVTTPTFAGVTIYPPTQSSLEPHTKGSKFVTNRFVFESSKIAELKLKAASESVMVPTRVEAITSLIWRCATNASRSNLATPKSTLMLQVMDLRLRIPSDVLPRDAIGNLLVTFALKKDEESAMEIGEIVAEFRKAKAGINKIIIEHSLQGYNTDTTITTTTLGQNLLKEMSNIPMSNLDIEAYVMSSWCKKPIYEVNFGWGTPVWIGPTSVPCGNIPCGMLMDAKDGEGVEAWVSLPEEDMLVFVRDQDLLTYAVLNPPILI